MKYIQAGFKPFIMCLTPLLHVSPGDATAEEIFCETATSWCLTSNLHYGNTVAEESHRVTMSLFIRCLSADALWKLYRPILRRTQAPPRFLAMSKVT